MDKDKRTIYNELTGSTNKKRKADTNASNQQEKPDELLKLLTTAHRRPVRRKLRFDSFDNTNNKSNQSNQYNEVRSRHARSPAKKMKTSFSVELENMLNVSLEENRKRCIEKYNFDPVLEKPLEGNYKWEKISNE